MSKNKKRKFLASLKKKLCKDCMLPMEKMINFHAWKCGLCGYQIGEAERLQWLEKFKAGSAFN